MPDRKRVIEILIIVIGGVYLLYRIFAPRMDTKQTPPSEPNSSADYIPAGPEVASPKEAANKTAQDDRKLRDVVDNMRDVFQRPSDFAFNSKTGSGEASKAKDSALLLEGTIWGHGKNVAILSGMVVVEGDIIQGGKVIKIEPDRVIILKDGTESEIKRGI